MQTMPTMMNMMTTASLRHELRNLDGRWGTNQQRGLGSRYGARTYSSSAKPSVPKIDTIMMMAQKMVIHAAVGKPLFQ